MIGAPAGQSNPSSIFGNKSDQSSASSIFGNRSDQSKPASIFGVTSEQSKSPFGQASSLFGVKSSPANGSIFGGSTGQSNSVFGGASSQPGSSFGSSSFTGTGLFGGKQTEPKAVFGSAIAQPATSAGSDDDEVEFVCENKPSAELMQKAEQFLLPSGFYLYEDRKPCKGCIGMSQ